MNWFFQFWISVNTNGCLDINPEYTLVNYNCKFFNKTSFTKAFYSTVENRCINIEFIAQMRHRYTCIFGQFRQYPHIQFIKSLQLCSRFSLVAALINVIFKYFINLNVSMITYIILAQLLFISL